MSSLAFENTNVVTIDVTRNECHFQILNGTRAIIGYTALRLAHFFGTSAEFWLNLKSVTSCGSPSIRPGGPSKRSRL